MIKVIGPCELQRGFTILSISAGMYLCVNLSDNTFFKKGCFLVYFLGDLHWREEK